MESRKAAAQIEFIWSQVARSECFRGYRPVTVATTGLLGIAAAIVQPFVVPAPEWDVDGYLNLWSTIAIVSLAITMFEVAMSYARSTSQLDRRLTRRAVQQFLPCLLGGGIVTWMIASYHLESVVLLPGLWAVCFGLGVFASTPFVTPSVVWAAVYYLIAGAVALMFAEDVNALSPWFMGLTFGVGQLLMAAALYFGEVKRDVET